MATPPSDDTRVLFRLLADGQWHRYQEIKNKIAEQVPPGRAIRRYNERLRQSRELRRRPHVETFRTDDEQIRLGAMSCAQVALTSWKGKGVMVRGEGEMKEIRIKPGFEPPWNNASDEPSKEVQDPGKETGGLPEVPPSDSEPSEGPGGAVEEPSQNDPETPTPAKEISDPAVLGESPVPEEVSEPAWAAATDATVRVEDAFPETDAAMRVVPPDPVEPEPAELEEIFAVPEPQQAQPEQSHSVTNLEIVPCPDCGMAILDPGRHEEWHRELKAVLDRKSVV